MSMGSDMRVGKRNASNVREDRVMRGGKRHNFDELRKSAEARRGPIAAGTGAQRDDEDRADLRRALHELEVHQIELELQNEELRATRSELELNLARYTELFDFAPIGYALIDIDSTIHDLNHSGARLLGRDRGRVVGTTLARYVVPGQHKVLSELLLRLTVDEVSVTDELELASALGERLHVSVTASRALRDKLILVALVDVTEARVRENYLAKAEADLREVERRKDDFLSMLSHELRNPLAPIHNGLVLLDRASDPEQARKAREVIERQVAQLTRLVDDLLDTTRIVRGKLPLEREPVELGDLVRATVDDHRGSFEASGVRLLVHVSEVPCWVCADAARMVQVVSNVLGNAEKFTSRGGSTAVVVEVCDSRATLRVRDDGIGIAPEMLPHLFEAFVQAPQTRDRPRGGLGLGLAMAKRYLDLIGGTIEIASDGIGRGCEVTLVLPTIAAPESEAPKEASRELAPRRVLVIDDNVDAADTLSTLLESLGNEVRTAYDGHSGLAAANELIPDVVLCDLGLPDIDGYEVARTLRTDARFRSTRLVALSGYAEAKDRDHSREAGFDEHLAKPATQKQIGRVLAEAN
jgi:two-component system, chemotaxis family, CheB/CheR fusion protein